MKRYVLSLALLTALTGAAVAQGGTGTPAQAKAMLERAIVALKADRTAALDTFRRRADGFGDRDLYVFCNALDGASVAHPDPAQASSNLNTLKDANGKAFGKDMLRVAQEGRISEVDYVFPRLGEATPVAKQTYVTRVGTLICGVGFYK